MSLTLGDLEPCDTVLAPFAAMSQETTPMRAMSSIPFPTYGLLMRAQVLTIDTSDDTVRIMLGSGSHREDCVSTRWVHVSHLQAIPADAEPAAPAPAADAPIIDQARRSGAAEERRIRDEAITTALQVAADNGTIDEDTMTALALALNVTMPAATYTVEVEYTVRRTLTVRPNNAEARRALREGDASFVEESLTYNGEAFDAADGDLTVEAEDGWSDDLTVVDIRQD